MNTSHWDVPELVERLELANRLRWAATGVAAAATLAIDLYSGFALDIFPSMLVAAFVLLYNVLSVLSVRRVRSQRRPPARNPVLATLVVFGLLDLAALAAGTYFTGGLNSPFLFMPLIYVLGASVIFSPNVGYVAAALATSLVLLMGLIRDQHVILQFDREQGARWPLLQDSFLNLPTLRFHEPLEVSGIAVWLVLSSMSYLGVYIVGCVTAEVERERQHVVKLLRDREKTLARLDALQHIGTEMTSLADHKTVLDLIVSKAREMFSTDLAFLALRQGEEEDILITVALGEGGDALKGIVLHPGQGLGGLVMVTGKPMTVADYGTDLRLKSRPLIASGLVGLKSGMAAPLFVGPRSLGVLYVFNRQATEFDASDEGVLLSLANHAAIAIENARLYTDLRKAALTDSLTGLHNSRYLQERLQAEMARASRYEGKLALIMVDCDSLKVVNDRFGHQAGDLLLVQMGHLLRDTMRDTDVVARYGGDEFIILLLEADIPEAVQVAERIRAKVEGTPLSANETQINITVSSGIATYPGDAVDSEDLLRKADSALYRAKRLGKNRICCSPGHENCAKTDPV